MTEHHDDDRIDAYLWDPKAPPAPEVRAVEAPLEALRFEPAPKGSIVWMTSRPVRFRRATWLTLAAAAALLLVTGAAVWTWRLSWPAGQAWTIHTAPATAPASLAVGAPLTLGAGDRAGIDVARIGQMVLRGDAQLTLLYSQGTRHRLALERGSAHVRVWAPPGSIVFRTPAGEVIDLGCEFELTVEPARTTVRVLSGWVQIENGHDETLIPAGATGESRPDRAPTVPVFDDAPPAFMAAVRALEAKASTALEDAATTRDADVRTIVATARVRDVFTLLMLIERRAYGSAEFAARAAELAPPPRGVTVNGILRGDREAIWHWRDTLLLPPAKSWLRNWRDGLPAWIAGELR
jgi:hypothetical protein